MLRAKQKSIALFGLLSLATILASACTYYDHDDDWRYGRYNRYDRDDRYDRDRYRDQRYGRYDWDRDHYYRWRYDRDRYSSYRADPLRNHYND